MSMKRITIERYTQPDPGVELTDEEISDPGFFYSGCIEGETDDGNRWIMFIAHDGYPEMFWPCREPDGAVMGEGTFLIPDNVGLTGKYAEQFAALAREIGDGEPTDDQARRLARVSYTDRTIYFYDEYLTSDAEKKRQRTVFVSNRRNPRIKGSAGDTGRAYWKYRRVLARWLAPRVLPPTGANL